MTDAQKVDLGPLLKSFVRGIKNQTQTMNLLTLDGIVTKGSLVASPVVSYVTEEVRRQGHDPTTLDGLERITWMMKAWCFALNKGNHRPTLHDGVLLGEIVEPIKNVFGLRRVGVHIVRGDKGFTKLPDPDQLPRLMKLLFESRDKLTPVEFYKAFEEIHPFVDGNGRTGKVLLNWLGGTLLKPVWPPNNLFGEEIENP